MLMDLLGPCQLPNARTLCELSSHQRKRYWALLVASYPGADYCTRSSEPLVWQGYRSDQCEQCCVTDP